MNTARRLTADHDRPLRSGRVVLQQASTYSVALDSDRSPPSGHRNRHGGWGSELHARRAASCLLAPQPGDRVLIALAPEPFILAVLEREGSRPAELVLDGDVRIGSASGRLDLTAAEGVRITTPRSISMASQALAIKSETGQLVFKHLSVVASSVRTHAGKLSVIVDTYDLLAERITQRAKRVYRFVEELDRLRARHFDYRAEELAQIKGNNTVVTARQVVKIDAEQIHVG